jgi:glyoxylase-like metal-dependent hydrolase (beta-lactamase superfamily II)
VLISYSLNTDADAMIIRQIGKRGTLFTFDDKISVFLITGTRFHLLCDTHLGPDSMAEIRKFLQDHSLHDRVVIFNSHSDWDHIWGNCAFPGSCIIGQERCRERMEERGEYDLVENNSLKRGDVRITPPNLLFSTRLFLEDEEIEFSYAPGHTADSAICYDRTDSVLYLGDLVEDPIPYLDAGDLDQYLVTLRSLITHPAQILVSGHSGIVTRDLIVKNMKYISDIRDGIRVDSRIFTGYEQVHQWNLNQRIFLQYQGMISQMTGDRYDPVCLLKKTGDLHNISSDTLIQTLDEYLSCL